MEIITRSGIMRSSWEREAQRWNGTEPHFLSVENPTQRQRIDEALAPLVTQIRQTDGRGLDIGAAGTSNVYLPPDILSRTVALDISKPALITNTAEHKVVADVSDGLPFSDDTFSFATMFFIHRYLENQVSAMMQVNRVLKPGGSFIALDHTQNNHPLEHAPFAPRGLKQILDMIGGFKDIQVQKLFDEVDVRSQGEHYYRGPLYLMHGVKV